MDNRHHIALIVSPLTLNRIASGLGEYVGPEIDFRFINRLEPVSRIYRTLKDISPSGVMLEFDEDLLEIVINLGLPTVMLLSSLAIEGIGSVTVNDNHVGHMAGRFLSGLNQPSIAYCGRELLDNPERKNGFISGISKGLKIRTMEFDDEWMIEENRSSRVRKIEKWILEISSNVAVFAAHHPLAGDVLEAAENLDLQIPNDVSILSGSDDPALCELVYPTISHIEIDWKKIGQVAAQLIISMALSGKSARSIQVETGIIRTGGTTNLLGVSDQRLQAACRWLQSNFSHSLTINDVAIAVGMNRRALERLFREHLQKSPNELLIEMRLEAAKNYLLRTDHPISEIAELSGFSRSDHLSSTFKKAFGLTPGMYRKSNLNRNSPRLRPIVG